MHPKRLEGLEITGAEMQCVETAVLWLNGCVVKVAETAGTVREEEEEWLTCVF